MKSLFLALALLSATTLLGQDSQSNPQPGTTPTDRPLSLWERARVRGWQQRLNPSGFLLFPAGTEVRQKKNNLFVLDLS